MRFQFFNEYYFNHHLPLPAVYVVTNFADATYF